MWLVGVRDLQYRRRRFLIAVIATSVVFSMTVLMSGLSNGLDEETDRIVASFAADSWVVADGASGPFTGTTWFSAEAPSVAVAVYWIGGGRPRPPSEHRLGPLHVPLEAQQCRHRAVAIPIVAVGILVTTCPRKQCAHPQQPDFVQDESGFGWRGGQPFNGIRRFPHIGV